MDVSYHTDLSLVISTWNRCRRLEITLDALTKCSVPRKLRWELVLVNNNSKDRTPEVCQAFQGKLPIVYVEEPIQGLSRARNTALRNASGQLIVFTDDDVTPCRNWLKVYWSAFCDKPQGYFFAGPVRSIYENDFLNDELRSVASASVVGVDHGAKPGMLNSQQHVLEVNWACSAASVAAVGAFDAHWGLNPERRAPRTSEGIDLRARLLKAGLRGWYLPNARVDHFVPAQKCTVSHIGCYRQAQGFYCAATGRFDSYVNDGGSPPADSVGTGLTVAGVPLQLGIRLLSIATRAVWREVRGETAYRERVYLRFYIGMVKGYRYRARKHTSVRAY